MLPRMSRALLVLAIAGCTPGATVTRWEIEFGVDVPPVDVALLELTIDCFDCGGCPLDGCFHEVVARGDAPNRPMPGLPAGEYWFSVEGFDDDCRSFGYAYDERRLPLADGEVLRQVLAIVGAPQSRCSTAQTCDGAGRCVSSTADGGT